ncbi:terpenoid synthase [Trametopsis cervina]|nr:terpenoid synthase [Trametopsis cervina]
MAVLDFSTPEMLYLPETMRNWPWLRRLNPHYEEVSTASKEWFKSFKPFSERSQYAFDKGDFAHLRTGIDFVHVRFLVDEYTDVEPESVVRDMINVVIDALHNPYRPRPEGETVLGEITRQFWERALETATPVSARRFIEAFTDYLESVVAEAADRDSGSFRTVDAYIVNRRDNIGARPAYVLGALHLSIPDHAFYHPVIKELERLSSDLIALNNDILSYNKEQATDNDRHNIITVVMHQLKLSLPEAIEWVSTYLDEVKVKFLNTIKEIPQWGKEIDDQVMVYIEQLGNWPRANYCWCFESARYFGSKGLDVQKTRFVPLLPKVEQVRDLHAEKVIVPLVDAL